jgi:GT2 family glycosyltransferase
MQTQESASPASPAHAIGFTIFREGKSSTYAQWQSSGRGEHLLGERKTQVADYELAFEPAKYLAAFRDLSETLGGKRPDHAFRHWMRHGLWETLRGARHDIFALRQIGVPCVMRTAKMSGEYVTLFALPGAPRGTEYAVSARDADGTLLPSKLLHATRTASGRSQSAADTIAGAVSTPGEPAQLFLGVRDGQGPWCEVMLSRATNSPESAAAAGLSALFEPLSRLPAFAASPGALVELIAPKTGSLLQSMYVDLLQVVNGRYLLGAGWFVDSLERWDHLLVFLNGETLRVERSECIESSRNDLLSMRGITENDVFDAGFVFFKRLRADASQAGSAAVTGISPRHVLMHHAAVTQVSEAPADGIKRCIEYAVHQSRNSGQLPAFFKAGAGSAFAGMILERASTMDRSFEVRTFGEPPANPQVSIIIPLHTRMDFIKFQLAQFSMDPELRAAEIIYVLDDPKARAWCLRLAELGSLLYRVPFKLVLMAENQGFGGANNAGASQARGEALVFLNSDVMPRQPGWLSRLAAPLGEESTGAVGARLLYHDGTIQHDGMKYRRREQQSTFGGLVECVHPGKGVLPHAPEQNVAEVPTITGACLALHKADFDAVGGFSPDYFVGDYEDSDLCLKLRKRGKRILIARDCVLTHLERQSVARTTLSTGISIINSYIHESKWGPFLQELGYVQEAAK